jgi:hypothetical protein
VTGPACVTLSYRSKLLHIGLDRAHAGSRVPLLAADLDVRFITDDGQLLRHLHRPHQRLPTPPTTLGSSGMSRDNCPECLATSQQRPRQDSNLRTRLRRPLLYLEEDPAR